MHRVLSLAAVAALLFSATAVPALSAGDASSILAKHKAYVGWANGDGTLKSLRATVRSEPANPAATPRPDATPDPLGRSNATTVVFRRELLYRSSSTSYGTEIASEGFTGALFWRANENGLTVTRRLRDARTGLTEDLIEAEALADASPVARPDAQFDGKTAAVVRLEPKTGVPADIFFDRETGAMLGYTVMPDVPLERYTLHVVSYAEFAPGKRYVAAWRYDDSKRTFRVGKFEPNVEVTNADLHPPAPRATWTFGEPSSAPITIVEHSSLYSNSGARAVHVDVLVNGKVGHFLLDSGAGSILMFERIAKAAGIVDIGRTAYSGVNGQAVLSAFARVDTLQIGGNVLHNVIVQHNSDVTDSQIDGLIGFDVLAGAVVDVDLQKHAVTIVDPASHEAKAGPGAYAFEPDLSIFHAGVPVKIHDTVLPSVWLDTGNDFFVILPHELEKNTVALNATVTVGGLGEFERKQWFGGVDGTAAEPANCVRMNEIQVGPYRYQKALSCFAPNDAFGMDGGLIGFDFLRHFNWTFDYPHGKVVLTPNGS